MALPQGRLADVVALVRAPAALSVPGDVLVGAAASGRVGPRTLGLMASSVCLYWAGMALNDYADAAVDAVERPSRPIPSGRVPRRTALRIAGALTAAGVGIAAAAGGRRALVTTVPLAGLVWAYDLRLKATPAGPSAMAGTRVLDVLTGAVTAGAPARGVLPALLVGAHTYTLSALSRHEISGAPKQVPGATLAVSALVASGAVTKGRVGHAIGGGTTPAGEDGIGRAGGVAPAGEDRVGRAVANLGALTYFGAYGLAQARVIREPTGANVRRAVGAGIVGLVPLQAALIARAGAPAAAAALALLHPLARRLARRFSPT